ncbi:MAG: tetratricopeptide repeat protein [Anaerolineae bacterium]|nr:tetratricopeptide repeat protein [Anaerolineae bacterium]
MSSTLLHQAVELAQAGQRERARQLILQFLQGEPNNEVAWLWLASVAADQAEYVRALNEVLRVNPENQRARNLLDEYYQQQAAAPDPTAPASSASEAPYARPAASVPRTLSSTPPSPPSPQPPVQPYVAPPVSERWGQQPPPQPGYVQPGYAQMPPAQPVYVERERVIEKRRGGGCLGCGFPGCLGLSGCFGCGGCGQGCLLVLLILLLPVIACGVLSHSTKNLGPLDVALGILPGEFGRKTIEIDPQDFTEAPNQNFTITLSVPRSLMLVDADDVFWQMLAESYDEAFPFADVNRSWLDDEAVAKQHPILIDLNPVYFTEGGAVIRLELAGWRVAGNYACAHVKSTYGADAYEYANGFCGYRIDETKSYTAGRVFEAYDPPTQMHTVTFYTPATATLALAWTLTLPEDNVYAQYDDHIDALIESVGISQ